MERYALEEQDDDSICYWCDHPKMGNLASKPGYRSLHEIQVTPDTRKDKGDDFWEAAYPSSKRESENKLLKLSSWGSMVYKCQLVSWTLSCFVAASMKTIQTEKSMTRAPSVGLMVWKQIVQGAGGKQQGPSTLTSLQARLLLQQQKAAVTRVNANAAQSYCSDMEIPATGVEAGVARAFLLHFKILLPSINRLNYFFYFAYNIKPGREWADIKQQKF